ncbi:MAG: acetate/propionate family kinase, partial [Candidatus Manganitrophaceae bacterium]
MDDDGYTRILTINSGSSSLRFSLYRMGPSEMLLQSGRMARIGLGASEFHVEDGDGRRLMEERAPLPDHEAALKRVMAWLQSEAPNLDRLDLDAVGHRLVHGGTRFSRPVLITPEVAAALQALTPLAPDHLPCAI